MPSRSGVTSGRPLIQPLSSSFASTRTENPYFMGLQSFRIHEQKAACLSSKRIGLKQAYPFKEPSQPSHTDFDLRAT